MTENYFHKEERIIKTYLPGPGEFPDFKEEVVTFREGEAIVERKIVYKPILACGRIPSQSDPPVKTHCGLFVTQSQSHICDRHAKAKPIGPCCGAKFVFPDGLEVWVCNSCFEWLHKRTG